MVRTCPCHGHGRGSTPRRIVTSKSWFTKHYHNHTTMTTTPNKPDFKKQLAEYTAKKAIDQALKPAPAVAKVQQGLVPAPKKAALPSTKRGKAGRIVGISADENKYIQDLLQFVINDPHFGKNNPMYAKIQTRYNK